MEFDLVFACGGAKGTVFDASDEKTNALINAGRMAMPEYLDSRQLQAGF